MKYLCCFKIILIFSVIWLITYFLVVSQHSFLSFKNSVDMKKAPINIAIVACGDRFLETLTLIKSILMFSEMNLSFLIFTSDDLKDSFSVKMSEWKERSGASFSFKILPLQFPEKDSEEWIKLFKLCAAQRLFLPTILPDIDSVVYLDTDTLFLTPIENVWHHFHLMNGSQIAALAPEHEDPNIGWYNRFARHPYYEPLGVNSGVMLMNLTRMREFGWEEKVIPIYKKYKTDLTWGDQDIINIIFHFHPEKLYIYSCRYNYRPDHCMYMSICKDAEQKGVAVVHGSRGFFHSDKQPVFKVLHKTFEEYEFGTPLTFFYKTLHANLKSTSESKCKEVVEFLIKCVKDTIEEKYGPIL